MNSLRSDGKTINFLATANIAVDEIVHIGNGLHGVAIAAITSGVVGALRVSGVFKLDALTAGVWAAGDTIFWDAANEELTDIPAGHKEIGVAILKKVATTQTTAEIILNATATRRREQTITEAGAIELDAEVVNLSVASGTYAVTLAAPARSGLVKTIQMTDATGTSVTLALTNLQGESGGTTATFNAVDETLILISGENKWNILVEIGVTLA